MSKSESERELNYGEVRRIRSIRVRSHIPDQTSPILGESPHLRHFPVGNLRRKSPKVEKNSRQVWKNYTIRIVNLTANAGGVNP